MHNSKFKKSIASTTIKNSLSKTSFPRRSLVLFRGGERPAEVRRMDQQFTKLDKKKSNNNNNNENNLKSNIFCLCSILLIHINRGISHHVYSLHIQREECTGATTERWHGGGSSPLCSEFRPEDKRPGGQTSRRPPAVRPSVGSFLSGHPHLPTYLPHTHIHVQHSAEDRLCGPAHRALFSPRGGRSPETGGLDPECRDRVCAPSRLHLPGCKTFIDTYDLNIIVIEVTSF